MKRTITLPVVVLGLFAAACTSGGSSEPGVAVDTEPVVDEPVPTDGEPSVPTDAEPAPPGDEQPFAFAPAALTTYGECSTLLDHIHAEAIERVGPYGLDGDAVLWQTAQRVGDDLAVEESATAEPAAAPQADAGSSVSPPAPADDGTGTFSTTNVQVDGVDEPDVVKTDGNRIIAIANETLHYFDIAEDGTTGVQRGSVRLSDLTGGSTDAVPAVARSSYGHEIFLSGDRAFVLAGGDVFFGGPGPGGPPIVLEDAIGPIDGAASTDSVTAAGRENPVTASESARDPEIEPIGEPLPVDRFPAPPPGDFGPRTMVFEVDLTDPDAPSITNSLTLDGRYVSARAIGDTARLVLTSPPQQLGFVFPSGPESEQLAEDANRDVVAATTIDDWLPTYTFSNDGGSVSDTIVPCDDVHTPANFAGFDMLSIVSIDLGGPLGPPVGTSTVMATGDTVYASQDRMYVSTNLWNPIVDEATRQWLGENYETEIHRFAIAGDAPARYEGSGTVDGHLLDQFSMNDRDGTFYVATTKGAPWSTEESSESQIVAMELDGDRLVEVGSVGGLGLGERIFSVRHVDDQAYVVTFRQVDPFYIVDTADPRAMNVVGELKIPGFSSYLHPISDALVVGVGQDATGDGRATGTKVSLFDVSDPSNPVEVDVWSLPDAFSDAEFDHRAFLYWPATSTAVLPLQSYPDRYSGAVVLNITADGIVEQGRISHDDGDDGPVGVTDCRVLTIDELGGDDENSELAWIGRDGGQVQGCTAQQEGGAAGLSCEVIPIDDLQYWTANPDQLDVDGYDRIEICWPNWDGFQFAIQRSLVIDDTLWTLSNTRLQANALSTLDTSATFATK